MSGQARHARPPLIRGWTSLPLHRGQLGRGEERAGSEKPTRDVGRVRWGGSVDKGNEGQGEGERRERGSELKCAYHGGETNRGQ